MIKKLLWHFQQQNFNDISTSGKLIAGLAAFVGILLLGYSMQWLLSDTTSIILIASMGASCVLLFALPSSPLSQPWPVIGGHLLCVTIGVTAQTVFPDLVFAAAVAVSISIIVMYFARCLHPPGGAASLAAVLSPSTPDDINTTLILITTTNAILIVCIAIAISYFIPGRRYPSTPKQDETQTKKTSEWALGSLRFKDEDLKAALKDMDSYIDISKEDLARIYTLAVMNASKRRIGEVTCKDIMRDKPLTFRFDDDLKEAWEILQAKNLKAAIIVDAFDRVIGIITVTDFIRHASVRPEKSLKDKLRNFLERSPGFTSDKNEVVGQIMSSEVTTASVNEHIVDLVPEFTEKGFHHMPVIDESKRLIGLITRSDLMRSLIIARP